MGLRVISQIRYIETNRHPLELEDFMSLIKKVKESKKFNKLKEKITAIGASIMGVLIVGEAKVFATAPNSNTQSIDSFINFACDWLTKIGGVIALVGGVMFALGWQREDAEGKSRGLMTLMAGFMLVAIAQSKNLFGL